jgi:hypothetical protein
MPVTKTIVCLANSRKLSGRCLAGREVSGGSFGSWIRPVSARSTEEVSEQERAYQNGSDPRVLDVVDIPLIEPRPKTFQSENWLLDPERYWVKRGRLTYDQLLPAVDAPPTLWVNGFKTYNGMNDRVPESEADKLATSLYLLRLDSIVFDVFAPGAAFGNPKRRVHAAFAHGGHQYALWVTDPTIEREYLAKDDGRYREGSCLITVSLGERDKGFCYKLVAAAIRQG